MADPAPSRRVLPDAKYHANLQRLVVRLKGMKRNGHKATLLIGAGCSITAGIPGADDIARRICARFPDEVRLKGIAPDDRDPNYNDCMASLLPADQRTIIAEYVKGSKVNWAHLAIAALLKEGYVDRVLTTNFDNLVTRACAILDLYPGTYDLTLYRDARRDNANSILWENLPEHSLFYLHGQCTGFKLLNNINDLADHAPLIGDCFRLEDAHRLWIVVGYSGERDPVFDCHLAKVSRFPSELYWAEWNPKGVAENVHKALFNEEKGAFYLPEQDADKFLVVLAQKLDAFSLPLVGQPFTHLKGIYDRLTPFPELEDAGIADDIQATYDKVEEAIRTIEQRTTSSPADASRPPEVADGNALGEQVGGQNIELRVGQLMIAGDHQAVVDLYESAPSEVRLLFAKQAALAYFRLAYNLNKEAEVMDGQDKREALRRVAWSYEKATEIKPDFSEAYNNWGIALGTLARLSDGEDAKALFNEACRKFAKAIEIKPDDHELFCNWGTALDDLARLSEGVEARALFGQACKKYAKATEIKPDDHEAHNNWGMALSILAQQSEGEEARALFKEACQKYAKATEIKPDDHTAFYNWGNALGYLARLSEGVEAKALFNEACQKHAKATEIKPDKHEAYNNWGYALLLLASLADGDEARKLIEEAKEKCLRAEALSPGSGAYNLACAAALQEDYEECLKWLEASLEHGELPPRSEIDADHDFDSVRDQEWFQEFLRKAFPE